MKTAGFDAWRLLFIVAALFLLTGGSQHPRGAMTQMLANPIWVQSHLLLLVGMLALFVGLIVLRRSTTLPPATGTWLRYAIIATALEVVEMAVHTAAVVDHANLAGGHATPVFTTHIVLSIIIYPIFAVTVIGLILAGMRERALGSAWIGWLGIIGAAAHGAAAPIVAGLGILEAGILFPIFMLFAFWLILAAVWPSRATARS
ncbi:MAG: hypothetical protein H0W08_05860 [Acidobacteria bacterium]|nr:hypothetical protein [Acidobacteriota bacterium]